MENRTQIDIREGMSGKINDQLLLRVTQSLACIWFPAHQKRAIIKLSDCMERHEKEYGRECYVFSFLWTMIEINVLCEQGSNSTSPGYSNV